MMTVPFRNRRTLFMLAVSAVLAVVSILAITRFGPADPEFTELKSRTDALFHAFRTIKYDEAFALLDSGWQQQLGSEQVFLSIATASGVLPESYRFDGTVKACEADGAQFRILPGTARVAARDMTMAVYFHREVGQWRVRGIGLDEGVLGVPLPEGCAVVDAE